MASTKTMERIKECAKFLSTPTAQNARGYLDKPLETALKVIDQFADGKAKDYEEIAEAIAISPRTVSQIINALNQGGYPLQFTYGAVKASTGRKPVAVVAKKTPRKKR